jgi:hypothetical protein
VSHRFLLELFLHRVIDALEMNDKNKDTSWCNKLFPHVYDVNGKKKSHLSKSKVESVLRTNVEVWDFIKSRLGLHCDMPNRIPNTLLYGHLSERVHSSPVYRLYLPNDFTADNIVFFEELARLFDCPVEVVDAKAAAAHRLMMTS